MGGRGGSICGLPLPLLVAAIIRAPANYRVVHLVILVGGTLNMDFKEFSIVLRRDNQLLAVDTETSHLYYRLYLIDWYCRPVVHWKFISRSSESCLTESINRSQSLYVCSSIDTINHMIQSIDTIQFNWYNQSHDDLECDVLASIMMQSYCGGNPLSPL